MTISRLLLLGSLLACSSLPTACARSSPQRPEVPAANPKTGGQATTIPSTATLPFAGKAAASADALPDGARNSESEGTVRSAPLAVTPCGPLDCLSFASAEDALAHLVDQARPKVLAVGEVHAQKGHRLAKTPTVRFADALPWFQSRAKHLVIELWTGRNDCGDDRVQRVKKAQEPVTSAQADTNRNDYFELGSKAKSLGIVPHALVPSCQDYQTILNAKSDDLDRMLELTATRTAELVDTLLTTQTTPEHLPEIVTYGGALHNDVSPRPGREHWSFGPHLVEKTNDRYVELDWVLREQVHDGPVFSAQPWYPHFRSETLEKHFTLYKTGPASYVLIFPDQRYLP
jgi:hypothetical protein